MPAQHFEAEELDRDTLDYLHRVVDGEGRGMPGLYFDADDAQLAGPIMPLWGLIAGPVIILLTLLLTWGSMRDPVPVAMLMTGGLFLGGWLIVAWVRCMVARHRDAYVGYFKYVDPRYLWSGTGQGVEVEPIDMLTNAEAIGSRVRIEKADGEVFLELRTTGLADEVEEYLTRVRAQTAAEPVQRGYAALTQLRDEEDEDEDRIDTIPSPRRERASRGWVVLILLAGVVVLLFFGCKALATVLRDDALFALVQDKDPAHLRIYLIDPRNTRHRDEVIQRLDRFHDQVARNLEQPRGDPQLRTGLASIVRGLKKEARPFITVSFVTAEKSPAVPEGYLSPGVLSALNQKILLEMRQAIQPLTRVPSTPIPGEPVQQPPIDLVDVAQVFEGPAMISIEAKVKPADKESRECRITWALTMQADPEAQKHVATFETRLRQNADDPIPTVRALYGNMGQEFRTRLGS